MKKKAILGVIAIAMIGGKGIKIDSCYSPWMKNDARDHSMRLDESCVKSEDLRMGAEGIDAMGIADDNEAGSQKPCEICGEKFHFVTRLVAHLRITHGILRPFKCRDCEKTYPHQFLLNAHVKKLHTPKTVACDDCGFMGVSLGDVERHKKRNHNVVAKFVCEICSETFVDENSLVTHTAMHDFMEFQQCRACSSTFDDASTLRDHNRLFHYDAAAPETGNRDLEVADNPENRCGICSKSFKYKSVLKQHRSRSHGERSTAYEKRRYLCALCGKELKTAKGLEIHNRSHTGEKPYTCAICGKGFACETLLRTHNVTHTGERKYSCDQCGKSFTQRSTLVVHKRYHSGERPYVCTRCAKGFVTRTVLKTHMKSCRL